MSVSSKSLFHFTSKMEFLVSILKDGFWPRYCMEYCWGNKNLAIPMVCFCDIPISQIRNHINNYGKYGIGVSKKWAIDKELTPLLYFSYKNKSLYKVLKEYASKLNKPSTNNVCMEERMLYFAKRVTASQKEKELRSDSKKKKFYNEREWRFVPKINEDIHLEILLNERRESDIYKEQCDNFSEKTKNQKLIISASDVNYIFIPESERDTLISELKKDFSDKEILSYASKIITIENIKEDF